MGIENMTGREILDAILKGMEDTARKFDKGKLKVAGKKPSLAPRSRAKAATMAPSRGKRAI